MSGALAAALLAEPSSLPVRPVPRYFAVLLGTERVVQICSSATGQQVGRLASPVGQFFSGVAETADGRRLLVAAQPDSACRTSLYWVSLDPAGQPGPLRPTSVKAVQGTLSSRALAMTPDGSVIAFSAYYCDGTGTVEILNLRTGSQAEWTTELSDDVESMALSANGSVLSVSGTE